MATKVEQVAQHKTRARRRELKAEAKGLLVLLFALENSPQPETLAVYEKRQELEGLIRSIIDQLKALTGNVD